MAGCQFES